MKDLEAGTEKRKVAISLFSGGGIGDIGIEWGNNIQVVSKCEINKERAALLRGNFPNCKVFEGDIWEEKDCIVQDFKFRFQGKTPWLVIASPPCQGMSANGAGRISIAIADGIRNENDERNRLILPSIEIIDLLKPEWFIFENVPRMVNTVIPNEREEPENIMHLIERKLGNEYEIQVKKMDFSKQGIPQFRERLITIGRHRKDISSPEKGNIKFHPSEEDKIITLRDAISHLEPLDAIEKPTSESLPLHRVPSLNLDHYYWIENTPEDNSAFNNLTCPDCKTTMAKPDLETQNILLTTCINCDSPLPRPNIIVEGWVCHECHIIGKKWKRLCPEGHKRNGAKLRKIRRLISGFDTSYRRMAWDKPAKTVTQNSGTFSSDGKGHPSQNRVLSLEELMILQTMKSSPVLDLPWENEYQFTFVDDSLNEYEPQQDLDAIIREIIGESIPPFAMYNIIKNLLRLDQENTEV